LENISFTIHNNYIEKIKYNDEENALILSNSFDYGDNNITLEGGKNNSVYNEGDVVINNEKQTKLYINNKKTLDSIEIIFAINDNGFIIYPFNNNIVTKINIIVELDCIHIEPGGFQIIFIVKEIAFTRKTIFHFGLTLEIKEDDKFIQ